MPTALSSKERPRKCSGTANVASTAESTACPERNESVSRTSSNRNAAAATFFCQSLRLDLEFLRRRALEAVDRLLRIADREERAHALAAGAVAGGEILGDAAQDLPLLGIGVLRLVDEHVIDAAVELVEHPVRVAAGEKRQGLVDEVLEIEGAEPRLGAARPAQSTSAARVKSAPRALERLGGAAPVEERAGPACSSRSSCLHVGARRPW